MKENVYVFHGNNLAVPEETTDEDAVFGADLRRTRETFGEPGAVSPAGGGKPLAGLLLDAAEPLPSGWKTFSVREAVVILSGSGKLPAGIDGPAADLLRVFHILQWFGESRFCGSCGCENGDAPGELARLCPRCGRIEYPRISPAVIVLIVNDRGEALLAHNKKFRNNVYSLIAGFAEAGESLETAAAREIREEVNVEVRDIRYAASQSWPFPNSLMVGFTARHVSGEPKGDGREILDAGWFGAESVRRGIPEIPARGSVSRYIIDQWLNNQET
jgi:NAD+ diphosphatase